MLQIVWRRVSDLPPCKAQDGTAFIQVGGNTVAVPLSVRPSRSPHRRQGVLALSIDGTTRLFLSNMRDCKGGAERLVRKMVQQ